MFFSIPQDTFQEISKAICKIEKGSSDTGTGFFLKTKFNKKDLYLLITAQHFIPFALVDVRKTIEIIADSGNIKQQITLNNNERKILCFLDKDITAIEILDNDPIRHNVKFLKYDKNCKYDFYKNYLNAEAFIFHHPNGEKLQCNYGKIMAVGTPKKYEFAHNLDTQKGSSGSPIFCFKKSPKRPFPKPRVIGVHTSCDPKLKLNIGTFINVLIEELKGGIDNVVYEKSIIMPKDGELEVPSGTHLFVNHLSVTGNSSVTFTGNTRLTIGGQP